MAETEWQVTGDSSMDPEEQQVIHAALDSFYQYAKVAHFNTTHLRRQSFYALPRAHWELLAAPPFSYLETLDKIDDAIDMNAEIAQAILLASLKALNLPMPSTLAKEPGNSQDWRGKATALDLEKARSTIRQMFRDWSSGAENERRSCYDPVINALRNEQLSRGRSSSKMHILVPGAGLARLVFELCQNGFHVEGNEISYHQLLASSYILNHCPIAEAHTLYPWVHSFSNHETRSSQLQSFQIPDIHPSTVLSSSKESGSMSMSASDFLLSYNGSEQKDTFDAVATVFFLDTAPNVIRYFEAITNCLRIGGLLVNFGPLLWHFENNAPGKREKNSSSDSEVKGIADPGAVELTNEEVLALIEKFGFQIEQQHLRLPAPYIQDQSSMMYNVYNATFWVARKLV